MFAVALQFELYANTLRGEKLKAQLATLRRARFVQFSEKLDRQIDWLERAVGDIEGAEAANEARHESTPATSSRSRAGVARTGIAVRCPNICRARSSPMPAPVCAPAYRSERLRRIGDCEREVLEYVASHFKIVLHVRPKLNCRDRESIAQPPMPSLPIERGRLGPGLIARCAGRQMLRPSAFEPPVRYLRPRVREPRPIDFGGTGLGAPPG